VFTYLWRVSAVQGSLYFIKRFFRHYGGSVDARLIAPERYGLKKDLVFLGEFKTNMTGSGFTKVDSEGVQKAKHKHFLKQ
jgi:hypothetical protein